MLAVSDLLKPSTRDQMLQLLLDVATSVGLTVTSWQSGQPLRTFLTTVAQKLADQSVTVVQIVQGGFGDLASGDWATLWAKSIYNVDVIAAQPATGYVTATNTSASNYTEQIGQFIVAHGTTGQTYRNTAIITINANSSLANIAVAADVPGTIGNAAPAAITKVITSLVGVTVTNPAAVLGADVETPAALVARARTKLGSLSPNGPKDAYNFVATTPTYSATGTPITRSTTTADPTTGLVTVCIATAAGAPVVGDVAIVQAALNKWATPWTVTATAVAASNNTINITSTVWIRGSLLTNAQIQAAINTALSAYFATVPIGGVILPPATGYVFIEEISQVIRNATPGILRVAVALPAADVSIAATEVPVLGTSLPTVPPVI